MLKVCSILSLLAIDIGLAFLVLVVTFSLKFDNGFLQGIQGGLKYAWDYKLNILLLSGVNVLLEEIRVFYGLGIPFIGYPSSIIFGPGLISFIFGWIPPIL